MTFFTIYLNLIILNTAHNQIWLQLIPQKYKTEINILYRLQTSMKKVYINIRNIILTIGFGPAKDMGEVIPYCFVSVVAVDMLKCGGILKMKTVTSTGNF